MFSLEELLFFSFFFSNLTAKIDKKQERFHEINQNLDFPQSSCTFSGIRLNISQNLPESSRKSLTTSPRSFDKIHLNLLEHSPESS